MRKQIIIAVTAVLLTVAVCFAGGSYYLFGSENDYKIISLEIPPFTDDFVLCEGETAYENYFEVVYENGFLSRDIELISENENVAQVKYSVTDRNRYVCYKVIAGEAGQTQIYFSANNGETVSEKIKVTVLPGQSGEAQNKDTAKTETEYSGEETSQEHTAEASETEADTSPQEKTDVIPVNGNETDAETVSEGNDETHTTEKATEKATEKTADKSEPETRGNTVYIAPTGKRYHYSKSCAGVNARAVSLSEAKESGRTPCKKCAGG